MRFPAPAGIYGFAEVSDAAAALEDAAIAEMAGYWPPVMTLTIRWTA